MVRQGFNRIAALVPESLPLVEAGVSWCQAHHRDAPAPFRFQHADVRNALYNPQGALAAPGYRFPYAENSFDLVIATSVFTHLLPDAAERYLAETARVLTPGGRLFTTWFLVGAPLRRRRRSAFASPRSRRRRWWPIPRLPRPPSPTPRGGCVSASALMA